MVFSSWKIDSKAKQNNALTGLSKTHVQDKKREFKAPPAHHLFKERWFHSSVDATKTKEFSFRCNRSVPVQLDLRFTCIRRWSRNCCRSSGSMKLSDYIEDPHMRRSIAYQIPGQANSHCLLQQVLYPSCSGRSAKQDRFRRLAHLLTILLRCLHHCKVKSWNCTAPAIVQACSQRHACKRAGGRLLGPLILWRSKEPFALYTHEFIQKFKYHPSWRKLSTNADGHGDDGSPGLDCHFKASVAGNITIYQAIFLHWVQLVSCPKV